MEEPDVLMEHVLDVYINETLTMKLISTAQYLTELVLGRLLTEGIIFNKEDISLIYVCEHGSRAKVLLKDMERHPSGKYVELTPSCCTGNHVWNDIYEKKRPLPKVRAWVWDPEGVWNLADAFHEDQPLHARTHSTHSAYLWYQGSISFRCEDIGRHNAVDKAIGYAMRENYDLHQCMIFTSGRVPTDMLVKFIRAGVPVCVSKEAPTAEAVQLAKLHGVTLICNVRAGRMDIFTDFRSPAC